MKSYSKTRGIVTVALFAVILALTVFTASVGWGYDFAGSARDIKLGLDLRGGVSITYQAAGDSAPTQQDMDDTIYKMQLRVQSYSTEASVYQEGANRITIDIPGETPVRLMQTKSSANWVHRVP